MRPAGYFGGDTRSGPHPQTAHDLRIAEVSNAKRIVGEISPAAMTGMIPGGDSRAAEDAKPRIWA
jgi:hypothetical protein